MHTTLDEIRAELTAEFPRWSILHTDAERWWALRTGRHVVSEVIADDPQMLREQLLELETAEAES